MMPQFAFGLCQQWRLISPGSFIKQNVSGFYFKYTFIISAFTLRVLVFDWTVVTSGPRAVPARVRVGFVRKAVV